MGCKICGFNKRGKQHNLGYHHLNLVRKTGTLQKDDNGNQENRTEKRPKPLEIEERV